MANFKLTLNTVEKINLRKNKISICDIPNYAVDELEVIMDITQDRAKEIGALIEFQSIKSIGIKFAEDLVSMGYYSIDELVGKDPVHLIDEFEKLKGYWIDPCVEDQFRLAVHYANTHVNSKNWWDFTEERKKYRSKFGYPSDRPTKSWFEM